MFVLKTLILKKTHVLPSIGVDTAARSGPQKLVCSKRPASALPNVVAEVESGLGVCPPGRAADLEPAPKAIYSTMAWTSGPSGFHSKMMK